MAIIIPGTGATGPIQTLTETVKNTSGGTLLKGTPVRITGATGQEANVGAADASTAFPANFVLAETLAPGESGQAVALGFINNVSVPNATLFTAGQEVYLAVGGGWTTTRPTGAANIQLLGNIVKVNTSNNTVSGIFAPQNIEHLPNLTQGKIWVGSAAGVPEESDPAPAFSGQIINGVAHFVSTTAPTFRTNAAGQNIGALVDGDRWYNPTTGVQAFRRAPYWLSVDTFPISFPSTGAVSGTVTSSTTFAPYSVFWESLSGVGRMSTGAGGSLGLLEIHGRALATGGSNQFTIFSQDLAITNIAPSNGLGMFTRAINYPVNAPVNSSSSALSYSFTITGASINVGVQLSVKARWIL